ncbi:hypothetical protein MOQ72_42625 [Saccharopolyspora sp. K220]|uniref:hypothetical protein n=1 Tax=Saccharopolyspora soli TaxID=2926618 RepID=UPI001F564774|nr:hypothetical protein [Saccharopolyspora soli]MCI2424112.1 hypothetical protein [Saccharopolyspora soli]
MITCSVPSCSNPVTGGNLCGACLGRLDADLAAVADLVAELDTTIIRQARTGQRVGARPTEEPLPFNTSASEIRDDLRNVLSTWVRDLWEIYGPRRQVPTGEVAADGTPVVAAELDSLDLADELPDMAAWLRRHPSWIAPHQAAGELVDEILDAIGRARRAIDLPPELVYCGPCPVCGTDLYARPDRGTVVCRGCEERHEVTERREVLLDLARDQLATAAEIARALPGLLGRELSANTVRTWAPTGRLAKRAPDAQGRPRYRVGDVIDLALS